MAVRIENNAEPIPGYKLVERLGGGGFGDVWKVEAPGGLFKAMKFVFGDLQNAGGDGQRAEQELKAMTRVKSVRHPYILSLERFDIIDGQLIIVMELADRNLWDRFKECRAKGMPGIPRDELLRYMEETAEALDLMNIQYQLQHLDIKPQNIFLVQNHVKVADFGLVKDLEGMAASVTGGVTPVYAAPETFDGWVSRYSDQYSLSIVYQEMLTGIRPFAGNNVRQLILQHLQGTPNVALLPASDQGPILRALAKKPDDRHPSCLDLVRALRGTEGRTAGLAAPKPGDTSAELNFSDTPRQGAPKSAPISAMPTADMRCPATHTGSAESDPAYFNSAGFPTQCLPRSDASPSPTDPARPAIVAVPEVTGDGCLFPAMAVGIGEQGLNVLQNLRASLHERFGSMEALPQFRLLYIDTDPEALRTIARGRPESALAGQEILLARLNRPSHYLRPRDGELGVDGWMDPQMLYRIPRTQITAGFRALGRLAFCDNYAAILKRLRDNLRACTTPDALTEAAKQTRLGLRTNQPRIYVIAGLAGGTGGGMFLDLAYVTRTILKGMGYAHPELIGLFLLPGPDKNQAHSLALANAYAALSELNHFSRGGSFTARYSGRDDVIEDAAPPFLRCMVLPMAKEGDAVAANQVGATAAEFLWRDLFTPLGRTADARRSATAKNGRGAVYQTFGLYRLSSPRRPVVGETARRLCQELVGHWMSKDAAPIAAAVADWVAQHWSREEYGAEIFISRMHEACDKALGRSPQEAAADIFAPVTNTAETAIDLAAVDDAVQEADKLFGQPLEETVASQPGVVEEALARASEEIIDQWGHRLTELVVKLIEDPVYRLAGAEEGIRQISAAIAQILQHQETLGRELGRRAFDAYVRVHQLCDGLNRKLIPAKSLPKTLAEMRELLAQYPKWRYQHLILRQLTRSYISLRGDLNDQLREVGFCRARLGELLKAFETPAAVAREEGDESAVPGRSLYSGGCRDLDQAVDRFLREMPPECVTELHHRIQAMIRSQFQALTNVCLGATNLVNNLEDAMRQEVEAFVASSPIGTDVAETFLQQYPDESIAANELATAFDEAAPELGGSQSTSRAGICILAVPPGPAGEKIVAQAGRALTGAALAPAASPDDILFYRESSPIDAANLEVCGPTGHDAYHQMTQVDHLTPHSRIDITFGAV